MIHTLFRLFRSLLLVFVGILALAAIAGFALGLKPPAQPVRVEVPPAQVAPKYTNRELARWACSDAIARIMNEPSWTRRSTWPTVETEPGQWSVLADFSVTNVFGVKLYKSAMCRLHRLDGGNFVTLKVEIA